MSIPRPIRETSPVHSKLSPEELLEQAEQHLAAREIPEALRHLETGVPLLRELVQAARVDAAESGSYARTEQRNRLSALREQITSLIARLEAARREVEDELTAVRSQKAFERQAANDQNWFESRV